MVKHVFARLSYTCPVAMRDNTFRLLKDGADVDFDADADDATACDATAFGDEVCCFFGLG